MYFGNLSLILGQLWSICGVESGIEPDATGALLPLYCLLLFRHVLTEGKHMAAELKRKGSKTIVLAMHPGEVAT